ncbi:MAG: metal-dependent hydrolase, partial [Gammaproteobacteria bacterium]|nr:metal-dependent hydrolase [Gammaproteobacteria bacterium]
MDTITHALSGMLLARATKTNPVKPEYSDSKTLSLQARLWAGFFAAAFPDIDIVASFFGTMTYLDMHRGITHSVIMLPLWAFVLAFLFAKISRNYYHWKAFYAISFLGIALHIAGDVITAYGTMLLAPLSIMKFAWPTTFIIDFYFSGIILLSIILFVY